jgi:nicotinate-nucleotide--dimethylbenzimidazole phosphoribosyltransferase
MMRDDSFELPKIEVPDDQIAQKTQALLDEKTKPLGSLGRLESLACKLAAIRRTTELAPLQKTVVVMAADHGVATLGVSAYPQQVTTEMLRNFARGGAAINVLCRQARAELVVVDMGVVNELDEPSEVLSRRVAAGTAPFDEQPAMTRQQAELAVAHGMALAEELAGRGIDVIALGEMGIGNSTTAGALISALTGLPPEQTVGRGTGIDEQTWQKKVAVVERAIGYHSPDPRQPLEVLAQLGGFEIAAWLG